MAAAQTRRGGRHVRMNIGADRRGSTIAGLQGAVGLITRDGGSKLILDRLQAEEYLTADQIEARSRVRLAASLRHAIAHTDYYSKLARQTGIDIREISAASAPQMLARIPVTVKAAVRGAGAAMRDRQMPGIALRKGYSSGTSGSPLEVLRDPYSIVFEQAIVHRQWRWAGISTRARRVVMRGAKLYPSERNHPPYWQYDAPGRRLLLSSYHLSEQTAADYAGVLRAFRPEVLQAYPSAAYLLSRLLDRETCRSLHIGAVFTSSEMLLAGWKQAIEEAFGCPVFDYYGNAERSAAIGTCEEGTYHVYPDYGWTEIVPRTSGAPECAIVGTPYHARGTVLVRYDSGDVATPSAESCVCGRAWPVIEEIIGRQDDFIVTADGRYIGRLDHVFKGMTHIAEAQIIQDDLSHIEVRLVPEVGYGEKTREELRKHIVDRTAADMQVTITLTDQIEREASGKFRAVVSRVRRG